jgi:hypothetical protein
MHLEKVYNVLLKVKVDIKHPDVIELDWGKETHKKIYGCSFLLP